MGVLLGAGATALADRRRWRRESVARLLELRTALNTEHLVAMEKTGRDLLRVLSTTAAQERAGAAAAFAGCNLGGTRQRAHVLATTDGAQAADAAFRGLWRARDCVATADQRDLQGLRAVKDEVGTLRDRFREVVRRDVRDLLAGSASWSA
ncbi:hypothetical protein ACWGPD_15310 [Streptomyces hirsutus]|uniref:hypothetical protein n=1 Tax=Streptomyces hirsutus TaxID=35620 RepID=UPI003634A821